MWALFPLSCKLPIEGPSQTEERTIEQILDIVCTLLDEPEPFSFSPFRRHPHTHSHIHSTGSFQPIGAKRFNLCRFSACSVCPPKEGNSQYESSPRRIVICTNPTALSIFHSSHWIAPSLCKFKSRAQHNKSAPPRENSHLLAYWVCPYPFLCTSLLMDHLYHTASSNAMQCTDAMVVLQQNHFTLMRME